MITLDALNLHLPSGMQERAPTIARLIAGQLSRLQGESSEQVCGNISQLNIGALHIHRSFSDAQIAQTIASAINEKMQHQLRVEPVEKLPGAHKQSEAHNPPQANKPPGASTKPGMKRQGGRV
ncbi:hypothetical protein [Thalassomonas actiniarum]|uniref:Uncharacterized protein n=1 Tax=Thalassomonas actiniarum TaxID=485447 RepID=A0AAF0C337_9GAMM|nr:hypothetical protein [Thalassomonas actiniarum]WDE00792.1 hypothetical protein SG35_009245 [Thalassomonas actiniarum]